jgi:hypothetical protein
MVTAGVQAHTSVGTPPPWFPHPRADHTRLVLGAGNTEKRRLRLAKAATDKMAADMAQAAQPRVWSSLYPARSHGGGARRGVFGSATQVEFISARWPRR